MDGQSDRNKIHEATGGGGGGRFVQRVPIKIETPLAKLLTEKSLSETEIPWGVRR